MSKTESQTSTADDKPKQGRIVHSSTQWKDDGTTYLKTYLRDADNELHYVDITGYTPRFWVPVEEYEADQTAVDFNNHVVDVRYGDESIFRDDLVAIHVKDSRDIPDVREMFDNPHDAGVNYTDRVKLDLDIETGIEVPEWDTEVHYENVKPVDFTEPDYRVLNLDIETDDRGAFPDHENPDKRILSVVLHDNYSDKHIGFVDLGNRTAEECFPEAMETGEAPGCLDHLNFESGEREMLIAVSSAISKIDPDILTGWNAIDFDYRYLLARMNHVGVGIGRMSRVQGGRVMSSNRWNKPFVEGRTIYDLLEAYKTTKFSELSSYKLDAVAEEELDEQKIKFDGGYFDLYRDDPEKFLKYNARDVRLCVDIDKEADVLGFKSALQARDGCQFSDTLRNGNLVEFAVRRRLSEMGLVGPSSTGDNRDFTGAVVFDPHHGLAENVVSLDVASLYPNNLSMFNMSPETVIDPERAEAEDIPYVESPSGICFRTDQRGIIAGMVDEMLDLKADLKQELKEIDSSHPEYDTKEERYNVTKTIVNSLYGVIGWAAFFMYDPDVAEACTLAGQECITHTQTCVDSQGYDVSVIYGDTDSVYVELPSEFDAHQCMEYALGLEKQLNEEVYPDLAAEYGVENRWEIEAEMYASRYLQTGSKKNYAYLLAGEFADGEPVVLDEPKQKINGYQAVRSDKASITQETQYDVISAVLDGAPETDIVDIIAEATHYCRDDPEWSQIAIPQGLGQKIALNHEGEDGYYAFTDGTPKGAHPRGAWNANHLYNANLGEGTKPKRIYLDEGRSVEGFDVICFEDVDDLSDYRDKLTLDTNKMIESTVARPNRDICNVAGVDMDAAMDGMLQPGLQSFV
jgi:DNA polymerase I